MWAAMFCVVHLSRYSPIHTLKSEKLIQAVLADLDSVSYRRHLNYEGADYAESSGSTRPYIRRKKSYRNTFLRIQNKL